MQINLAYGRTGLIVNLPDFADVIEAAPVPGVADEAAAIRECIEETGVQCSNLKPLISYHPSLDIWNNYTYVFYSELPEEIALDSRNQRGWIPLEHCIDMVFTRQLVDSLSIVALLTYNTLVNKR